MIIILFLRGLVTEKTDETLFVIDKKAKEDTPSSGKKYFFFYVIIKVEKILFIS